MGKWRNCQDSSSELPRLFIRIAKTLHQNGQDSSLESSRLFIRIAMTLQNCQDSFYELLKLFFIAIKV